MKKHNKSKEKFFCQNPECDNEIAEPITCCSGQGCGCMGLPIEPPVCSIECLKVLYNNKFPDSDNSDNSDNTLNEE